MQILGALVILNVFIISTVAIPKSQDLSDVFLTVPEMITKYGYPVEIHKTVTVDGYVLSIHRIPHGKNSSDRNTRRPVVWLQHGLLCDSSVWVINDEKNALAYALANNGYDVWMGNMRGNTYSRQHVSMTTKNARFWDFSFHEMAVYDIPASFDYVTKITGQEKFFFIGHSMGTTIFFVAMAERPELNKRIRLMMALSPIVYSTHAKSPLALLGYIGEITQEVLRLFNINELLATNPLFDLVATIFCRSHQPIQEICASVFFLIGGDNIDQINRDKIPTVIGHLPAGTSTQTLVHVGQGVTFPYFRQYNYGRAMNLRKYGTPDPPMYNLSKIVAPVAFVWGPNDWLASPIDLKRLASEMPNLQINYRVKHNKYTHLDFLFAKDNDVLLVKVLLGFMKKY